MGVCVQADMARLAEGMVPGSVMVTVMMPLPSEQFEVIDERELRFSWGFVETYVQVRKQP